MAFDALPDEIAEALFTPLPPLDDRYALFVRTELKRTALVEELRALFASHGRQVDARTIDLCAGLVLSWSWDRAADAALAEGRIALGATMAIAERLRAGTVLS